MRRLLLLITWLGSAVTAHAQFEPLAGNATAEAQVAKALGYAYNYQFTLSQGIANQIKNDYPDHPVGLMIEAVIRQQRKLLGTSTGIDNTMLGLLDQAIARCEGRLKTHPKDPEATFFALTANALKAQEKAEHKSMTAAIGDAKSAYGYLKDAFGMTAQYPELYLPVGLYHYYVVQYPQTHPGVKPFMFFFSGGDKAQGLAELNQARSKGNFTVFEASIFLGHIYLKYEKQPAKALSYLQTLHRIYPGNLEVRTKLAECYLRLGKANEAAPHATQLKSQPQTHFKTAGLVYSGWVAELSGNPQGAQQYYAQGLQTGASAESTTDQRAEAYCGLARLANGSGQPAQAKTYYRKALDLAEHEMTKAEAQGYLSSH